MNAHTVRCAARRPLRVLVALAAGSVAIVGCARADGGVSPPRRHVVEISGMQFRPAVLGVADGDTVVWINRDIVPHTATALGAENVGGSGRAAETAGASAAPAAWDTGTLAPGDSVRVVVSGAVATAYKCALHPTMRGELQRVR